MSCRRIANQDFGKLKYFWRIDVAHSKKVIIISQQKNIADLLKETNKTTCKPVSAPNTMFESEEDGVAVDKD